MKLSCTIAAIGVLVAGCRESAPPSTSAAGGSDPVRIVQEVQRVVPDVSASTSERDTLALLPAHFSDRYSETARRAGPALSGENLYLFPDHSYLYLQWPDIMPPTIVDRGTWQFEAGFVSLQSDHSVRQQDSPNDRRFVPLYHKVSGKRTLLLMGASWDFFYFKEKATTHDDVMLLLCTLTHIQAIEPANAETLRKKMYADNWKPAFVSK